MHKEFATLQNKTKKWLSRAFHIVFSLGCLFTLAVMGLIFHKYIYGNPTPEELAQVMDPKQSLTLLTGFLALILCGWFISIKVVSLIFRAQDKVISKISQR